MFADPPGCSYSVFLLVVVISWNTCAVKRGSQSFVGYPTSTSGDVANLPPLLVVAASGVVVR